MTFRKFIKTIANEDTCDGDFAKDFLRDYRMKGKNFKTRKALMDGLPYSARPEAIEAAKSCWYRYLRCGE